MFLNEHRVNRRFANLILFKNPSQVYNILYFTDKVKIKSVKNNGKLNSNKTIPD